MSLSKDALRLELEAGEILLLAIFWTFAFGIFVASFSYPGFTGSFPRLFAGLVLIGTTVLLIRNWLPESMGALVANDSGAGEMSAEFETETETEPEGVDLQQNAAGRPITDTWFIALSTTAFFVVSFLIGMIWAAPLYALGYALWFRKSWQYTIGMMTITLAICYAFFSVLNIGIDTGWLHEFAGIA
jgi:hypothetical protein